MISSPLRLAKAMAVGLVSTGAALAAPPLSHATFPGQNGRLVFAASCEVLQLNRSSCGWGDAVLLGVWVWGLGGVSGW